MKFKKFIALGLVGMLSAAALIGCEKGGTGTAGGEGTGTGTATVVDGGVDDKGQAVKKEYSDDEIVEMSFFATMTGTEINNGANDIQKEIAKRTGVSVKERWLVGQTASEAVETLIATGNLPDFIDGGDGCQKLYDEGLLVPWDEYLEMYPNLKEMYNDYEWSQFRQADGHIYWANIFQNSWEGIAAGNTHNDEAFWVQVKVLEWDNYPTIKTLDQYFDLLERYYAANPTFTDNSGKVINVVPYSVCTFDWLYFSIENPGQFLAGYPNDGSVIVDTTTKKIVDYNTTDVTKKYFKKLNEEYKKGIIDKEFATQSEEQYKEKVNSGRVLGLVDQNWHFNVEASGAFNDKGGSLHDLGLEYVPLGITIDESVTENRWHTYGDTLNTSSGIGVTTSCADPNKAFAFLSACLDDDVHNLRFWGIEGEDYLVDDNGLFYRTQEIRDKWNDPDYQASHICAYGYFPQFGGMCKDGINARMPGDQVSEFQLSLSDDVKKCFDAYNANNFPDMIGSVVEPNHCWFPMWSYSNTLTDVSQSDGAAAWINMGKIKHEWIPKVVTADDFDATWDKYMDAYAGTKPEDFLAEMQGELDKRIAAAAEAGITY